jgi:7-keto-8-aminopelargonate synthetase-like enzyme
MIIYLYLCSPIVASAIKAIDLIENDTSLPGRVLENAKYFRNEMQTFGFKVWNSIVFNLAKFHSI